MKISVPFRSSLIALTLSALAPAALANCDQPSFTTNIPDGKSATQEQMDNVYEQVSQFVKLGEDFIACAETNETRAQAQRLRNQMLDEMEKVAAQFNRQLRVFKRANG